MSEISKLILVTGGARSGKSEFAERYLRTHATQSAYIATAEVLDEEMKYRVQLHRQRRMDSFWINYEAPYHAENILKNLPSEVDAVLFDCLTVYVSNMMYQDFETTTAQERWKVVQQNINTLLEAARNSGKTVVFVTNEVGDGIVPDNPLAREYRDVIGWVNTMVATACSQLYWSICGHTVEIKQLAERLSESKENI